MTDGQDDPGRIAKLEARIRELEGERMSQEEVEMCVDCLRWAHYSSHYQRGVRLALADRLACGLLEKTT